MKTKYTLLSALSFALLLAAPLKAQWTNGQAAAYVIGQTGFSASSAVPNTDSTFGSPFCTGGMAIDSKHGCLYIADLFAHRVLRYAYPLTGNSPHANLVFGHTTMTASTPNDGGLSASSLDYPGSCTVDTVTGTLWVGDNGNHRMLRFDNAYAISTNNPMANQVLGQASFTTNSGGCSSSNITINNSPITGNLVHYDQKHNQLWVVDNGNNRILRFDNPMSLSNGASANAVIGQSNFTTGTTGSGQNGFNRPDGVTTIGDNLFISDAQSNRILRFDSAYQLANGSNATAVLGQTSFAGTSSGLTQSTLSLPSGLAGDASGTLYVSDLNNNRVMIFTGANTLANGANAAYVLLKSNFTTSSPSSPPTASLGGTCSTIAIDNKYGNLVAMDRSNNRYLVFNSCGFITGNPMNDTTCATGTVHMTTYTTIPGLTYQWQENQGSGFNNLSNAGIYSGVTTATLTMTGVTAGMNGYTYRCVVSGTCLSPTNSAVAALMVNVCAGINEHQRPEVRLFPNPSDGEFHILNLENTSKIEVFNTLGELVYSAMVTGSETVVNLQNQASGVYQVRVSQGSDVIFHGRLVKQD